MSERDDSWEIEDAFRLTDADWIELNKLRKSLENGGGEKAFQKSFKNLAEKNPGLACTRFG
jgi:hypothetical protein